MAADPDTQLWDVCCLMCGSVVGQIVEGRFIHDPNCQTPMSIAGGQMRCCRCGGTLVRELATLRQTETLTPADSHLYNHSKYGKR